MFPNPQDSNQTGTSTTAAPASTSSHTTPSSRELRLQVFIRTMNQMSHSGHYSTDFATQLRDRAQEAQKLLCSLQQS